MIAITVENYYIKRMLWLAAKGGTPQEDRA
jgi:hypothetical protein